MLSSADHGRSNARNVLARLERLVLRHYGLTLIEQRKSDRPRYANPRPVDPRPGGVSQRPATFGRARAA
jgi:hypothetical protein